MANRGSASKRFSKLIRYFNFQQRTVVDPVTQQETIEEVPVLENVSLEASTDVTVSGKQVVTTANNSISAESLTIDTAEVTYNDSDSSLHVNGNALAFKSDIGNNAFPSGTKMLFQQTSAPTGWTKDTTHNNKALRVTSGTVGTGGNVPFSTVFGITATNNHTLTAAQMPSHTHNTNNTGTHTHSTSATGAHSHSVKISESNYNGALAPSVMDRNGYLSAGIRSNYSAGGITTWTNNGSLNDNSNHSHNTNNAGAHSHSMNNAGSGGAHSHGIDLRVHYVDVIIATKD